jgi:hypothetical protein
MASRLLPTSATAYLANWMTKNDLKFLEACDRLKYKANYGGGPRDLRQFNGST